jgi:hypothetical protein
MILGTRAHDEYKRAPTVKAGLGCIWLSRHRLLSFSSMLLLDTAYDASMDGL